MTSSRSNASINRWLVLALLACGLAHSAFAERKRVVVLPFEGDEKAAEKFHAAVVKLVKKTHTVVPVAKWESTAESLSAPGVGDKNIKKVAKKLKVDGVIEGRVEKRRDSYLIKLRLHAGKTGSVAAKVDTKAEGIKLDGDAAKDVKGELIAPIDDLDSVRGGGGDDEEEADAKPSKKKKGGDDEEEADAKPSKKKKGGDEEEADAKPSKKKKGGDEEADAKPSKKKKGGDEEEADAKPAKASKFGGAAMKKDKGGDEEEALKPKKDKEEDDNPLPAKKRPKKGDDGETEVAKKGDGDEIGEVVEPRVKMDAATAVSPGNRAIDATVGLSFNARRLSWKADGDLATGLGMGQGRPPNYKGTPAPGATVDVTAYPLAFGHKNQGMLKNLGFSVMYDQALLISSKSQGETKKTQASRYAVGAVFRYPFGKSATSPVIGASVAYGGQKFQIEQPVDLPNVNYASIQPGVFFRYPLSEKLILNADASYLAISKTGQMTKGDMTGYGKGSVSGIDATLGGDYMLTKALFARAALDIESIGYKFGNNAGTLATGRDADPEQDVFGARDTYIGVALTVGYLY